MSHRISTPPIDSVTCETCRFWDDVPTEIPFGICRRRAPQAVIIAMAPVPNVAWPNTHADEWCGEWQEVGR